MTLHASNIRTNHHHAQSGVALIVSLIILLVMTMLGIAGIRSVTQEERMSAHTYDRSLAFQAVENALRSAEVLLETVKPTPVAGSGCNVVSLLMVCSTPAPTDTARWMDTSFASWQNSSAVGAGTLAVTPQYFVEYLGNTFQCQPGNASDTMDCKRYRVTARSGDGTDGRASVMLQSIYATD